MNLTWKEFLQNHEDNKEFNKAAEEVANLFDKNSDKTETFTKLMETQPLVVVLKSAVGGAAQYLFNLFKIGN